MLQLGLLWITAALLSSPLLSLCDPLYILTAPNLLRVGAPEKVFVEAQGHTGGDLSVRIFVKNFPQKNIDLTSKTVVLDAENEYKALVDITIPKIKNAFSDDPLEKQYVYLEAHFPASVLEKVVLVSFQSGYIFIQTDKSIYTPSSTVKYRAFSLTPDLQPLDENPVYVEILNPQQIVIHRNTVSPKSGILNHEFKMDDLVSPGIWTIATWYKNYPQKNFTAEFEVKEYVLPTFEVTLTPSKSFFYVDDEELRVDITAKYLFGNNVEGSAFAVFGVMQGEQKTSLTASLRRVTIKDGVGHTTLKKEMIQKTFSNIKELVGSSLYISVSVLTDSGSEMVEAQRRGIQIVTSPYTIHFKRTPKFFKPGMPFDVMVYVTNPDQTPAKHVPMLFSSEGSSRLSTTNADGLAKISINTQLGVHLLQITATTQDPSISKERQDTKLMTAHAFQGTNYLHIGIDAKELKVGDNIKINLNFGKHGVQYHDFTYLILSKGQIVLARKSKRTGQDLLTVSETVTKDMLPSFRMVAYYNLGNSEFVADSVWVDVTDTCMGTLKVEVQDRRGSYEPREKFDLRITGDPGAKVGLVAVDKAVFVLNKNRLTQDKIWNIIEKHDIGCTAGSGKDSMGVFYDAGLLFKSNKAEGTDARTTTDCPTPPKRKRRAPTVLQITTTLIGKYTGELKKCCADGLRRNKLGYTCERRATFITDGEDCVNTFLHCCKEMQTRKQEEVEGEMHLARSEDEDYDDFDVITSRTEFPESWLWEVRELPTCGDCATTTFNMANNYLMDSITTWQILAISLSKTHGICVADPYEMIVRKDFFLDLKLPYSAVRNEQLEIKAILHNYSNKKHTVRVEFTETQHVCSSASRKGKYRTTVNVEAKSSRSIPYIIIPMELGEHSIEVKAVSRDGPADGIKKTLKVVTEGVLTEVKVQNVELNPQNFPGGEQFVRVRSDRPEDQVPGTPAHTYFSLSGHEVSQTIEQVIDGNFMGRLIVQPSGCGEQNMILMTLPVIAVHYLDTTKQWEGVGMHRRTETLQHIKTGYNLELTFRKGDGSFAVWSDKPSSTWLTAYVTKVFAMASDLITIEEKVLCNAVKWLIEKTQKSNGMFTEVATVYHGEMVGDVQGKDADASLTAFVLIAIQEASQHCDLEVPGIPEKMEKAVDYLEHKIPTLTNPYAVAMTSYAMANADKFNKALLLNFSSENGSYWKVPRGHHFTLEATAYALLALVKAKEFDAARKAVHWLNGQTNPYGSAETTQATIMVFQSVAEYYKQAKTLQNVNMYVKMSITGKSRSNTWTFKRENLHQTRSDKIHLKEEINVTATGNGVGSLKVATLYYARPIVKKSDCTMFDVSIKMQKLREASHPQATESYSITIETFYKHETRDATMSILDIGLLTGFVVDEQDLNELSSGKDQYIQKFEVNNKLSERGSLILYLDKVSRAPTKDIIVFKMHKVIEVAMLQPAAVTVYEYCSPRDRCTKYYHPLKKDGTLSRLCNAQRGLCYCAEENCSIQKKEKIDNDQRETKACEVGLDYVYKVRVVSADLSPNTDIYTMKIENVLKEGSEAGVEGKERIYIGHPNCRESYGFEKDKAYLIMGQSADLPKKSGSLQYILGEQTWIEYWPTSQEGGSYKDLKKFNETISIKGCAT